MKPRPLRDNIYWLGAVDWDRRLFDSLIPLPDGTSYNAYLVRGREKTALVDTADPAFETMFMDQLKGIGSIDYVISQHGEQDHSGAIPAVLCRYPDAKVVASSKAKELLIAHLNIEEKKIVTVEDGQQIDLGGYTLQFIYTPWVHWPETMCTYVKEEKLLFSCDFFGSHIASSSLYADDEAMVYQAAKRYYAEIMMPFRSIIKNNIQKLEPLEIEMIAPSHGAVYRNPGFIIDAYREWISDTPKNLVVIPYISMHGSTKKMVEHLVASLTEHSVAVKQFELSGTDLGTLAISLVDAATLVVATPTVHMAPHPLVSYAAGLANALHPKVKFATVIGSYGWSTKVAQRIAEQTSALKVTIIDPVLCKGNPGSDTFAKIDQLADSIAVKHKEAGLD